MKYLHSSLILFTLLFLSISSYSQADTNYVFTYESAERSNPYEVYNLSMVKYLSGKRNLPKEILRYTNCRRLNLSAPTKRIVKGKYYYGETKFKELPSWIGEMNLLTRIEICGNPEFKYEKELGKLVPLTFLRVLELSPAEVQDELIEILGQFKQIRQLVLYNNIKATDPKILKLAELLPDCEISIQ